MDTRKRTKVETMIYKAMLQK